MGTQKQMWVTFLISSFVSQIFQSIVFSFRKEQGCLGATEFCGGRHTPEGRLSGSKLAEAGSGHGLPFSSLGYSRMKVGK